MSERSHVHPVFLPVELYIGISKVQAQLEIGKSSAILLMVADGLFHRGLIDFGTYETMKQRYERKLVEIVRGEAKPQTMAEREEQMKLTKLEKTFSGVLEEWGMHNDEKWRAKWIARAEQYKDRIHAAKLILDLANDSGKKTIMGKKPEKDLPSSFILRKLVLQNVVGKTEWDSKPDQET
jgi:hypothetical protein